MFKWIAVAACLVVPSLASAQVIYAPTDLEARTYEFPSKQAVHKGRVRLEAPVSVVMQYDDYPGHVMVIRSWASTPKVPTVRYYEGPRFPLLEDADGEGMLNMPDEADEADVQPVKAKVRQQPKDDKPQHLAAGRGEIEIKAWQSWAHARLAENLRQQQRGTLAMVR